ncbi:putative dehydrogenase [Arthrobacter crystallopoietes BAB-32]|uniref:Putative dehydrogenase n=1 Tax=Arthrobacter crystallopoietes BAB-32 TaxID=1246476 RepID=N1V132_9MICC|nr:NAD(P)/FAD-dependent oxidoreductase [Arthrobacter crystallopoietes]EMY33772.1 putative dehydrogenase [Arthrobacter crystallopoietes BAB-32]
MTGGQAAVVGAGPNGLAAAVILARAGLDVTVFESAPTPGGGARTIEAIEPGHWHDVCSAVHPMAVAAPFFREFGLTERVELINPEIAFAHVVRPDHVAFAHRDLDRTAERLGVDGEAYRALMEPLVARSSEVLDLTMNQLLRIPRHPVSVLRYGLRALEQGSPWWDMRFKEYFAPALLAGVAAHTPGGLQRPVASGAGLMLGSLAHAVGYPIPARGSQAIIRALIDDLVAHGGKVVTGHRIDSLAELTAADAILLDTSPQELVRLSGGRLPRAYAKALSSYRYGPGAAKLDFILSGPVPWANPELAKAGTVHLGGTRYEVAASEREIARGQHSEKPFVLVSQPSTFDPSRAPAGHHVLWTYCHVPQGSTLDMTEVITAQLEEAAPGFSDVVVASQGMTAMEYERYNANYVGGDFGTGAVNVRQLLARPVPGTKPWQTPLGGVYLCSAATPPGPGVHGMAGYHAARLALKDVFRLPMPSLAP